MLCPFKVNSNTIELTVYTSCYWGLRLTLCYRYKKVCSKMTKSQLLRIIGNFSTPTGSKKNFNKIFKTNTNGLLKKLCLVREVPPGTCAGLNNKFKFLTF